MKKNAMNSMEYVLEPKITKKWSNQKVTFDSQNPNAIFRISTI